MGAFVNTAIFTRIAIISGGVLILLLIVGLICFFLGRYYERTYQDNEYTNLLQKNMDLNTQLLEVKAELRDKEIKIKSALLALGIEV